MTIEQRISKGQEPFKRNNEGFYDMTPVGVLLFAAEALHPTHAAPPESPTTIRACNLMLQRVAARAKRNGCQDTAKWLDRLSDTDTQERMTAADELCCWMTFTEFQETIHGIKD